MARTSGSTAEVDLRAFDPIPFPGIGPGVEFNANFCRNPMCPNIQLAPDRKACAGRCGVDADSDFPVDRRYVFRSCGMSSRLSGPAADPVCPPAGIRAVAVRAAVPRRGRLSKVPPGAADRAPHGGSGAGYLPQHPADDVNLVARALVRVGRGEAEPAFGGERLDALDHAAGAVPEHQELTDGGDAARGVEDDAVAPAKLRLHRVAGHLEDAQRLRDGGGLVADHGHVQTPAGLLMDELLVPGPWGLRRPRPPLRRSRRWRCAFASGRSRVLGLEMPSYFAVELIRNGLNIRTVRHS